MEKNTLELLEFPKILKYFSEFCVSEKGKRKALELRPYNELTRIKKELMLLEEARVYRNEIVNLIDEFPSLDGIFSHVDGDKILDEDGFWAIRTFLEKTKKLKDFIEELREGSAKILIEKFTPIPWPSKLWQAIKRCIDQNGQIREHASPSLLSIRTNIRKIQKQCTKKINDYIADKNISNMLQDEYLTISSDRYVIALKANFKGKIQGIVHDYSQTGETCYFEPLFLVELNNKLQELKKIERDEINKILKYLTSLLREEYEKLKRLYNLMVEMDILRAKVLFAEDIGGNIIEIVEEKVCLKRVRHPILYLKHRDKIETVDIILEGDQRALILTGGNSGGKTVSLKTLGLCAIMAYTALAIPCARGSSLPFWRDIFVFLGDEQSLDQSLSTFTAQIKKIKDIWPRVNSSTLVLLDEFGSGTDPSQGAALAQAVLDSLLEKGAWIFSVTHFPSLKFYALDRKNVRAAMVLFDPNTKKPLYKIAYDQVGTSHALDVAREFGMPKEILDRANNYLLIDDEKTSSITEKLNELAVKREKELKKLEQKIMEVEEEKVKLKKRYQKKLEELVREIGEGIKEILSSYREQKIQRKLALKKLKEYKNLIKKQINEDIREKRISIDELEQGREVIYLPWNKKGTIEIIDKKSSKLKLNISGVSIWVNLEEVGPIGDSPHKKPDPSVNLKLASNHTHTYALDIRGKRVDEAESIIIQFLDKAIYRGANRVEIIHGRGEGILRSHLHKILKEFPYVESFSLAPEDRGGDGVTLVNLR